MGVLEFRVGSVRTVFGLVSRWRRLLACGWRWTSNTGAARSASLVRDQACSFPSARSRYGQPLG